MSKTRLDDSRWPLVVFTAVGEQTEAEFEAFLSESDTLLRRREPYGVIFDARRAAPINPKLRRRMVTWLARNEALLRFYVVASSVVMSTALQRGVFRAILWMRPLPYPYSIDTSLEEARAFVCSRLAARGCPNPPPFDRASVLPTRERARRADSG
ncbi:MAG TPA: hypothetical protein VMG12_14510 [Polyangiaceae bacterium]|nr:hypothetical protein [Polyangiaceae bacterium]